MLYIFPQCKNSEETFFIKSGKRSSNSAQIKNAKNGENKLAQLWQQQCQTDK